jgi:hypothetical protein
MRTHAFQSTLRFPVRPLDGTSNFNLVRRVECRNKLIASLKGYRASAIPPLLLAVWTFQTALAQSTSVQSEPAQDAMRGAPGVAASHAVMNFTELARQAAALVAASPEAGFATPAGFTPASMGGTPPSPAPADSFLGFLSDNQFWVPDAHGAVGPGHLVTLCNFRLRVQARTGQVLNTVNVTSFWSAIGPFAPNNSPDFPSPIGDNKVLYDPSAARWIVTGLYFPNFTEASLLIGVSQTTNPTGVWNLYRVDMDPANLMFFDYPMIGFNKDWIVVQGQMYDSTFAKVVRSDIYVFSKTNLYAGGAGLYTLFQRPESAGPFGRLLTPAETYDNSLSTMYLVSQVITNTGTNLNQLRLYTITGPVGAEVFTPGPVITTTNRWDNYSRTNDLAFLEIAPQLGSTRKLDMSAAFPLSVIYRNSSLWVVQNIFLPSGGNPTRSSVQWWQLTPAGEIVQQGLIDDPDGKAFYGYPTLAVNQFNDVLIGYSRFATNIYPSAGYSFRLGSDPPNMLRPEVVFKVGEATYDRLLRGVNRWADYSQTTVDPLNDADLWTIQEYAATPTNNLSQWGTWWARVAPYTPSISDVTVAETSMGTTSAVLTVRLLVTNAQTVTVDFATSDGTALAGLDYVPTNGTLVFNPGEMTQTIAVPILDDLMDEANEMFFLALSNPTNIVLGRAQAQAIILDNDPPPAVSINDIMVREGDAGLANATFTISLPTPSGLPVSFRAITANASATLRLDYLPTNIVVTVPPGVASQSATIKLIGDTLIESNETFFVNLSSPTNATLANTRGICTILDDDFKATAVEFAGTDVRLSFATQTNQTYRVERTESLAAPILWEPVPGAEAIAGTGVIVQVFDAGVANQPQRFYRIRLN